MMAILVNHQIGTTIIKNLKQCHVSSMNIIYFEGEKKPKLTIWWSKFKILSKINAVHKNNVKPNSSKLNL